MKIERLMLDGLEHYDSRLKGWMGDRLANAGAFRNWKHTDKAGAVTCWPVGNTALEPEVEFLFTETPPASGDKGPDNPSTITGVSSVGVADRSKNIYDFPNLSAEPYNGVTIICDADGTITLNGTCNLSSSQIKEIYYSYPVPIKNVAQVYVVGSINHIGGTYNVSGSDSDIPALVQVIKQSSSTGTFGYLWLEDTGVDLTSKHAWISSNSVFVSCSLRIFGGAVYNNYKIKVQYEISNDSTTPSGYEPPARDSSVVIPFGDTYYGGTLDVATGVMTVTWVGGAIPIKYVFAHSNGIVCFAWNYNGDYKFPGGSKTSTDITCTNFQNNVDVDNTTERICLSGNNDGTSWGGVLAISETRIGGSGLTNAQYLTNAQEYLSNNSVVFVAKIWTTFTVQLSPTEILSLTQADKYTSRLNTVYTDASSVQVGYRKSPIRDYYEKTQAIIAQGGEV